MVWCGGLADVFIQLYRSWRRAPLVVEEASRLAVTEFLGPEARPVDEGPRHVPDLEAAAA